MCVCVRAAAAAAAEAAAARSRSERQQTSRRRRHESCFKPHKPPRAPPVSNKLKRTAVGVQQHLEHRARAERGADDVGHGLARESKPIEVEVSVLPTRWRSLAVPACQKRARHPRPIFSTARARRAASSPTQLPDRAARAPQREKTHLGRRYIAHLRLAACVALGVGLQDRHRHTRHLWRAVCG